jgi:hypothetical protein
VQHAHEMVGWKLFLKKLETDGVIGTNEKDLHVRTRSYPHFFIDEADEQLHLRRRLMVDHSFSLNIVDERDDRFST